MELDQPTPELQPGQKQIDLDLQYWKYKTLVHPWVCEMSLIGTPRELPLSWGNYMSVSELGDTRPWRVLNMWKENFDALGTFGASSPWVLTHEGEEGGRWVVIYDSRVPDDWYYNKLCFTGYGAPGVPALSEIYKLLGDPTGELELFTDPVAYHAKCGNEYDPVTGIWSGSRFKSQSQSLVEPNLEEGVTNLSVTNFSVGQYKTVRGD
jgi:hypothetical protein